MSGICYLILCHENVGQVKEIVEFLSADDAFFVVHVDRKAREDYSCLTGIPRVHVMQERVAVEWGGLSVVDAVIRMSEEHPEYHRYHEDTQIPDEIYFNTIVHNAKRCIVNDTKKYVSWKPNCGSSPIWMTYPDDKDIIDDCISNPDIFFVRKIKDSRLIEYIKLEV